MLVDKLFVGAIFSTRETHVCVTGDLARKTYVIIEIEEEGGRLYALSFDNLYDESLAEEFQTHEIEDVSYGIVLAADADRVRKEYGEARLVPISGKKNFFLNPENAEMIGRTHAWIQSNWNFRQLALKKGWY